MTEEETPEVEAESVEEEVETEEEVEAEEAQEEVIEAPEKEEKEIPVRSNASYIIERKNKKIEKLQEQVEKEADPVMERLERIEKLQLEQADDRDLSALFEEEPDARKYEKEIKAYMEHEAYSQVPPSEIYKMVSYNDFQSKKDSKREAADLEAAQTKSAGSSVRGKQAKDKKTAENIKNMTDAEFREYEKEQMKLAHS